jgi:hypothetical protein
LNQGNNSNLEDNNLEDKNLGEKNLGDEIDVVRSKYNNSKVTLEQFLAKLWLLSKPYCEREWITGGEFLAMLDTAYASAEPQTQSPQPPTEVEEFGFKGWQSTILEQIYDLYDLAKSGPFSDGLKGASGQYWHNFDVDLFLECANGGQIGNEILNDELSWSFLVSFLRCGQYYE